LRLNRDGAEAADTAPVSHGEGSVRSDLQTQVRWEANPCTGPGAEGYGGAICSGQLNRQSKLRALHNLRPVCIPPAPVSPLGRCALYAHASRAAVRSVLHSPNWCTALQPIIPVPRFTVNQAQALPRVMDGEQQQAARRAHASTLRVDGQTTSFIHAPCWQRSHSNKTQR
jgi:hypothetical protein